ncbi:MATE family efflux transporter [Sporolactobacillus shoreicorticis]|uniref:Probable multidrug resistance protein NorM n=1 Tax=Sporolactobacillus shoreicorticis TaxID=1923877 RepID=A0ABW5S1E0_9BACL|nr:MATE family efflux transporter [Sporolactobacillus shoreicorticis]MCO7126997.1 MATE family efflux transporter [Sporolactobacillus shoreicorticis]
MDAVLRKKILKVLTLALPAMIESLLQTVVGFVDTLFVARLGLVEVTAVGVANTLLAVYIAVFMAIGIGTSSIIAKHIGAGDADRAREAARQSTWITLVAGLLFGAITLCFAEPLLRMMGASGEVLSQGVLYFRIVGTPAFVISLMINFGNILRASGNTVSPMMISFWMNLIHIVLDYVLIYGIIQFTGFGVGGAASATVLTRIIGSFMLHAAIRHSPVRFSIRRQTNNRDTRLTWEIIRLSIPATGERLIMRLGQVVYLGLIVHMGTEIYAANAIAENIEIFAYLPGLGLNVAATVLVGNALGAKRYQEAYSYGLLAAVISTVIMSITGVLLFFMTPLFAVWFTDQVSTADMITLAMRIDAFFMPSLAIGLVLAGALQGAGDTKTPMYSTAIGMWGIRVVFIYLLGVRGAMGIAGIWIAQGIDLTVKATFLYLCYRRLFRNLLKKRFNP